MTGDALVALERAGFSRRDFLKTSGALIVVFSSVPVDESLGGQGPFGTRASHIDPARLDSWIAIDARGTVTAYTGKCELGQGMQTAQMQLVAEELSIPIAKVRLVMCDTAVSPDQGTTSGSQSTPTNFNDQNLARAAASARASLLRLGAERLQLGTSQVMAVDGAIRSIDDPSRRVAYGALLAGSTLNVPLDLAALRKAPRTWTVLGTAVPRVDMVEMATGRF